MRAGQGLSSALNRLTIVRRGEGRDTRVTLRRLAVLFVLAGASSVAGLTAAAASDPKQSGLVAPKSDRRE